MYLSETFGRHFWVDDNYEFKSCPSFVDNTGDFDKALQYFNEAENFTESCGSTKTLAHTLDSIGYTYIRMGDYKNAMKYLNRSL